MYKVGDVIEFNFDGKCGKGVVTHVKLDYESYENPDPEYEVYLLGSLAGTGHNGTNNFRSRDYWYVLDDGSVYKTDNRIFM